MEIMMADGFSLVTNKSKMCARKNKKGADPRYHPSFSASEADPSVTESKITESLQQTLTSLEGSQWFNSVLALLEKLCFDHFQPHLTISPNDDQDIHAEDRKAADKFRAGPLYDMVCYGIGHFGVAMASRVQVLFL